MTTTKVLTTTPTVTVALPERDWRLIALAVEALRTIRLAQGMPSVARDYGEAEAKLLAELEVRGVHDAWMGV